MRIKVTRQDAAEPDGLSIDLPMAMHHLGGVRLLVVNCDPQQAEMLVECLRPQLAPDVLLMCADPAEVAAFRFDVEEDA